MANPLRKRRALHLPITLTVVLMTLNIALMVFWIVLLAQQEFYVALTIGTVLFALILIGLTFYMVLSIKQARLHQQQANFVDSVTHELKSPLASLRLYLDTLRLRSVSEEQRGEFYGVMETELRRLDDLISHLLEVGRLDAIGHEAEPEDVSLEPLLRKCAHNAAVHHGRNDEDIFRFDVEPAVIHARPLVLEMIFGNLLDNAIKYGAETPEVDVQVRLRDRNRVLVRIGDNGEGVPAELRKKIFRIFVRGGNELERRTKGTGLGLYIVRTLVRILRGKVSVTDRAAGPGSVFEVELPGSAAT